MPPSIQRGEARGGKKYCFSVKFLQSQWQIISLGSVKDGLGAHVEDVKFGPNNLSLTERFDTGMLEMVKVSSLFLNNFLLRQLLRLIRRQLRT